MQKVTLHISTSAGRLVQLALQLRGRRRVASLPAAWEEVQAHEVLPIMKALMRRKNDRQALLKIIRQYLPVSSAMFHRIAGIDFLEKLIPLVEWMVREPMLAAPMKVVKYNGEYLMPAANFENVRLDEYIAADEAYERLVGGDASALTDLVACLLREREEDASQVLHRNDERVPLDTFRFRQRIIAFQKMPAELKFYVAYFYSCNKQHLFEKYKDAFDGKSEGGTNNWEDVLTDLAEAGPFGTLHDVKQITVHTFFQWLLKHKRRHAEKENQRLQDIIKNNHKKFLA